MSSISDRLFRWAVSNPARAFYLLSAVWWTSGLLTIACPLLKWNAGRQAYYGLYGRYIEYENAQRNYERAQEYQNEQANYGYDQYGNYVGNGGQYDQDGNWNWQAANSNNCGWWNFGCRRSANKMTQQYQQYMQQNGGDNREDRNSIYTPSWYNFLGGKVQGDSRDREEMGMESGTNSNGGSKFVYFWTLALFALWLTYGFVVVYRHFKRNKSMTELLTHYRAILLVLLCWFQFSLLMLILIPQGVIATDDRDLEQSPYGWYGQWGVLLVYWEFGQCLFTGIAAILLGSVLYMHHQQLNSSSAKTPASEKPLTEDGEPVGEYNRVV